MTRQVTPRTSERHGFKFNLIPTIRGAVWGGGDVYPNGCAAENPAVDYGRVLDCVYEMADDVASANGVAHEHAVDQVLRAEGWRILPTHRTAILARLAATSH